MPGSLFEAIERGDEAEVRRLLDAGADANELGSDQRSPLIEAAARGHVGMLRLLLEHGAEPAWKDSMEETALLKAAANGHRDAYGAHLDRCLVRIGGVGGAGRGPQARLHQLAWR